MIRAIFKSRGLNGGRPFLRTIWIELIVSSPIWQAVMVRPVPHARSEPGSSEKRGDRAKLREFSGREATARPPDMRFEPDGLRDFSSRRSNVQLHRSPSIKWQSRLNRCRFLWDKSPARTDTSPKRRMMALTSGSRIGTPGWNVRRLIRHDGRTCLHFMGSFRLAGGAGRTPVRFDSWPTESHSRLQNSLTPVASYDAGTSTTRKPVKRSAFFGTAMMRVSAVGKLSVELSQLPPRRLWSPWSSTVSRHHSQTLPSVS